jgi:hypothetical protein
MNFTEFQGVISKINGVISCKISEDNNALTEIHILANNARSPKQIARDVESSILASFDYRIDRKIISIAQIQSEDTSTGSNRRIKFSGISLNSYESTLECCVKLLHDEEEYSFTQLGIKTISNRKKIVADTTIKVVEKIIGKPATFEIQDVMVFSKNEVNFVTVLANIILNDSEETLVGSVMIGSDTNEAIVKATLSAINRRIEIIKE